MINHGPLLRKQGHEVYTSTLTGLGERSHLLRKDNDLDTHIQDVIQLFEYEDLNDVILVGHSYGGMVIGGAAEKSEIACLTSVLPHFGQACCFSRSA